MKKLRIALVSAVSARELDEDLAPLLSALSARGILASVACWDDGAVAWSGFDAAILRSTWDYTFRLGEFRDWLARVQRRTRLFNPVPLLDWNLDKRYLLALGEAGVPVIPTRLVAPGEAFEISDRGEFVLKPSIGAGARGARRFGRGEREAAMAHAAELHGAGHTVMVQPYLGRVDRDGETALVFYRGQYSHAFRKGPLLKRAAAASEALFATESIESRLARPAELDVGVAALRALPGGVPLYARVDLIEDDAGQPRVLELELIEPSLYFHTTPGSAERFAAVIEQVVRG